MIISQMQKLFNCFAGEWTTQYLSSVDFFFFERFLCTCLNFIVFRYEATRSSGSIALICYQDATRKAKLFPSN